MTQQMRFLVELYDLIYCDPQSFSSQFQLVSTTVMASSMDSEGDQAVPDGGEPDVKTVQAHYLRSPSPSR